MCERGLSRFAREGLLGYAVRMLRRVISAFALLALASAPIVGRTRLFCRYTGVEITHCNEQDIPGSPVVQVEGCCDRQVTRPLGVIVNNQQQEIAPPALHALPAPSLLDVPVLSLSALAMGSAAVPTGPPVLLITRALLI